MTRNRPWSFQNPTKIIFGEGQIKCLSDELPQNKKVLITYGSGSIKENGVYNQVIKAIKGFEFLEFGGIEPNPTYETLMKAVALVKKEKVGFLLAVGGGSVIDGTKFIAAAALYSGKDPWEIFNSNDVVKSALPFGTVLTLPATGSEMNCGAVISRKSIGEKRAFLSPVVYPQFSILDPTTTYSLPKKQISNGIVDAFAHVIEQYLTYPVGAALQDRFAEGILLTLIEEGPKALKETENYNVRANIMWAATLALNGLIGVGVPQDWSTHMIGHEITAQYGLDHAQTLAIVLPGTMKILKNEKREKLLQYAERIWNISSGSEDERINLAIQKTENFFESIGVKTHLSEYNLPNEAVKTIVGRIKVSGMLRLGENGSVTPKVVEKILEDRM